MGSCIRENERERERFLWVLEMRERAGRDTERKSVLISLCNGMEREGEELAIL